LRNKLKTILEKFASALEKVEKEANIGGEGVDREEFERIQDELGMIPNTLFEKRDRKIPLKCPNCNKETIHKRVFF